MNACKSKQKSTIAYHDGPVHRKYEGGNGQYWYMCFFLPMVGTCMGLSIGLKSQQVDHAHSPTEATYLCSHVPVAVLTVCTPTCLCCWAILGFTMVIRLFKGAVKFSVLACCSCWLWTDTACMSILFPCIPEISAVAILIQLKDAGSLNSWSLYMYIIVYLYIINSELCMSLPVTMFGLFCRSASSASVFAWTWPM